MEKNIFVLGELIFTKTVLFKLPTQEFGVILRIFESFLLSILALHTRQWISTVFGEKYIHAIKRQIKPDGAMGRSKKKGGKC